MKTLIAVPCMDQVPALFCKSLATMQHVDECLVAFQMGSLVYTSRNELAKLAIQSEADYVLWLDSDMVFDADLMVRMFDRMKELDADILTGLYFRRVQPYTPVLFDKLDIKPSGRCNWTHFEDLPDEPFKVGGCGFGCVLMSTDVLMSVQAKNRSLFAPIGGVGEDLSFCWRARDCGYDIWCDPNILCGHVGYAVVNDSYFRMFKEADHES